MLLSLQFPLADVRKFVPDSGILNVPTWPAPSSNNFIHYFGAIRRRRGGGVEGWGENNICHSRRALRFAGSLNFTDVHQDIYLPLGCAFRRFNADGYAVGKYEVGLTSNVRPLSFNQRQTVALIKHFLELPIRIPNPMTETKLTELGRGAAVLADFYTIATTANDTPAEQVQKWWVSAGPPLLMIEYGDDQLVTPPRKATAVPTPGAHGLTLDYYRFIHHGRHIPLWLLGRRPGANYEVARTLRLYLMRLHAEHECLKLVLQHVATGKIAPPPGSQEERFLQTYVKEAVKNISGTENRAVQKLGIDIGAIAYDALSAVTPHEVQELLQLIRDLGIQTNSPVHTSPPVRQWVRQKLLPILTERFTLEELKTLCFMLNVGFDRLPGDTIDSKARELILWFERHQRDIKELVEAIRQRRPDLSVQLQPVR